MTFLINLLWFVLGGFLAWCGWMLGGVLLAISIVGLPWAFAAFRIAGFAAWPFGRQLVDALWIAHVIAGVGLCLTVIGIPFGLAHFKLAAVSFAPLGKRVVS